MTHAYCEMSFFSSTSVVRTLLWITQLVRLRAGDNEMVAAAIRVFMVSFCLRAKLFPVSLAMLV